MGDAVGGVATVGGAGVGGGLVGAAVGTGANAEIQQKVVNYFIVQ